MIRLVILHHLESWHCLGTGTRQELRVDLDMFTDHEIDLLQYHDSWPYRSLVIVRCLGRDFWETTDFFFVEFIMFLVV